MIEYVVMAAGAAGVGWLMRRKHLSRVAAGPIPGIPGMARRPAGEGRWRSGRLYVDQGAARWVPGRGEPVPLPGGRATAVRAPSVREGISINPGSRIVTCAYEGGGTMEIAVMPLDLRELLGALPQDDAPEVPETTG
ncbi:hypothetical protein OG625_27010 [Streptomyces sp. NBC_01351]|uniref:hypothetical protein n=1 Tax=Streptomyces sp. NBC_01351 TaxID=2903833 RepID=UPI002E381F31|nr:hypothetical protein [Streptomyces sp. NBC_01351]